MTKKLKRILCVVLVVCMSVCVGLFATACTPDDPVAPVEPVASVGPVAPVNPDNPGVEDPSDPTVDINIGTNKLTIDQKYTGILHFGTGTYTFSANVTEANSGFTFIFGDSKSDDNVQYSLTPEVQSFTVEITEDFVSADGTVSITITPSRSATDSNITITVTAADRVEYELQIGVTTGIVIEEYQTVYCYLPDAVTGTYTVNFILTNNRLYDYFVADSATSLTLGSETDDNKTLFQVTEDMIDEEGRLWITIVSTSDEAYETGELLGKIVLSVEEDGKKPGGNFGDRDDGNKGNTAHLAVDETVDVLLTDPATPTMAMWQGAAAAKYKLVLTCSDSSVNVGEFTITVTNPATGESLDFEYQTFGPNAFYVIVITEELLNTEVMQVYFSNPDVEDTITISVAIEELKMGFGN